MTENKADIRRKALLARQTPNNKARAEAEQRITEKLQNLLGNLSPPKMIAGYSAIRGEVDCAPILKILERAGHHLCLPVVTKDKNSLSFRAYKFGEALSQGYYNIPEPAVSAGICVPDIVLVPLVGFNADCHRIGYGAGYYDRSLAHLKAEDRNTLTIGLGFSCQKFDNFAVESHDRALDMIVTENRIYKRSVSE